MTFDPLDIGPKQDDPLAIGPKQDDPLAIGPKQDDPLAIGPKQDDPLTLEGTQVRTGPEAGGSVRPGDIWGDGRSSMTDAGDAAGGSGSTGGSGGGVRPGSVWNDGGRGGRIGLGAIVVGIALIAGLGFGVMKLMDTRSSGVDPFASASPSALASLVASPAASGVATFPVTVVASPSSAGIVLSSPVVDGVALDCGIVCAMNVPGLTALTLTATPYTGYAVGSWMGCDAAAGPTCTVFVTSPRTIYVSFLPAATPTPEPSPSPAPTPAPTKAPTPAPTVLAPCDATETIDTDGDTYPDGVECLANSDIYNAASTPEGPNYLNPNQQNSCMDQVDNDLDGFIDGQDKGCGGNGGT